MHCFLLDFLLHFPRLKTLRQLSQKVWSNVLKPHFFPVTSTWTSSDHAVWKVYFKSGKSISQFNTLFLTLTQNTQKYLSSTIVRLLGWMFIAPWHDFHMFESCVLAAVSSILPRHQILNLFLHFLNPFVMKHHRIFVTVMWSKFHCHVRFSRREP